MYKLFLTYEKPKFIFTYIFLLLVPIKKLIAFLSML